MNPSPTLRFSDLSWSSRFVESFPGDPETSNSVRKVRDAAYSLVTPTPVSAPKLIGWSDDLASELGIQRPTPEDTSSLELLSGNRVLPQMRPYSARYGGHQFGHWAQQLGDGRAITLGEALIPSVGRLEFQLKGAGPTPYSRRADGRAVLRSSVREFLCSEAMHFLGVPTTRALSLVSTGDEVIRDMFYDGNAKPEPGAIVCRVSPSFLRFGNFEILTSEKEYGLLKRLADFLIQDHYPEIDPSDPDIYGKFLDAISRRTAHLITNWMRVGFVHGVMNTDNMSALGLTIDYGPYGWLEPYEPGWTPNTTDAEGRRYCYGNQPGIAHWNLARLCEAFYPLVPDEARLRQSLAVYAETLNMSQIRMFAQKLGVSSIESKEDQALAEELFRLLQESETDYTIFFRSLCDWKAEDSSQDANSGDSFIQLIEPSLYSAESLSQDTRDRWKTWARDYTARIRRDGTPDPVRRDEMKKVNPKYVLRNYLAQSAIQAAEKGDTSVIERLLRVLKTPYADLPAEENLAARRPDWARNAPGCSALSCSS